jgi:predicted ATPase/DNA-binding SARP family transcriptional activator
VQANPSFAVPEPVALTSPAGRGPGLTGAVPGGFGPVPLTRFVGRTDEVIAVTRQVGEARLVTLAGPGGSGKTRLALTVYERLRDEAAYRWCWWAELAELDDPALLPAAVAAAAGVTETPGSSVTRSLVRHLRGSAALLVLDNCEHVVESAAGLAGHLLRSCPGLRIMTTSREPLGVTGETTWAVGGLTLPEARPARSAADLAGSEAVQLFADRARLVRPDFEVTDRDAETVARLCRRLDGMPLALELAAARLRVLPLRQIVERLDDVFSLLVTSARDAVPRHQTLRATLDWSHDLLPGPERALFARLSVFRGGFGLAAAEAVAGPAADGSGILGRLTHLVEKSLVQVHDGGEEERYRLLEVVRQYAEEKLGDQRPAVARRHAAYYLEFAQAAERHLATGERKFWLDRLHRDHDNLRAALTWSRAHDPVLGLRLAGALWLYCRIRGHYAEGREWLKAAVAAAGDQAPPAVHAEALCGLGRLEFLQCEYDRAAARLRQALDLYGRAEQPRGVAETLNVLGSIAREQGDNLAARRRHEESLQIWRRLDDPAGVAYSLGYLAFAAWLAEDYPRARHLAGTALRGFRDLGDAEGAASALIHLGAAAYREGDHAQAGPLLQESLALSRRLAFREGEAWSQEQLGLLAAARADHTEAVRLLRAALVAHHELGDRWGTASALEALAGELALGPDARPAARLLAAAAELRTSIGMPRPPCDRRHHERRRRSVEDALGPDELATASAQGRAMSLEQVVAAAVAADDQALTPAGADQAPAPATPPVVSVRPAAGELRVHALRRARVEVAGRPLGSEDWTYAKPRELLYLLLTRPDSTKADIGLALWPDANARELRSSFHTCMKHLRRALGDRELVLFREGGYRIDRSARLWYDVDHFEAAAGDSLDAEPTAPAIPALAEAADRYPGDFLVDLAVGDWATAPRQRLRRRHERVMLTLGRLLVRERRYAEAAETFARLVEHEPLLEVAHRGLMRCHAAMGNRARALQQYQELVDLLDSQLGTKPAPQTTALYGALLR